MRVFTLLIIALLGVAVSCNTKPSEIETVSAEEVYNAVYGDRNTNVQLVDVRTPEEYGVSHLKNAQNICVTSEDFKEKVKSLDKNKPVYVYCRSGGRSARAALILHELGFKDVYDLQGGITAWQESGKKVTP